MHTDLRLRLLGAVQVEREGRPVPELQSGMRLALLGYLVAQREPLPRELASATLAGVCREVPEWEWAVERRSGRRERIAAFAARHALGSDATGRPQHPEPHTHLRRSG